MLKYILLFLIFSSTFTAESREADLNIRAIYNHLDLEDSISYKVFEKSYNSNKNQAGKSNIYSIIDFSKPSNVKRFVIIDSNKNKLLKRTYVAHGKNTGQLKSSSFSNTVESYKTSLGIYKASETYNGKYGYSLKLDGLSNTNSNARKRNIVLHPAKYASEAFLKKNGYLGRSWGCPSVDPKVSTEVINLIKGGSYIYAYN